MALLGGKNGEKIMSQSCDVCGASVAELRRGRCWGCYSKWADGRAVGMGAACCMCNDRRREHLRQVELLGAWVPICHNCCARTMKLEPMPQSLDAIRQRLDRERRVEDRRIGKPDTRVFRRDRRGLERRHLGNPSGDELLVLDDDILMIEALDLPPDEPGADETRIQLPPTAR
jgi:hypothetical protein